MIFAQFFSFGGKTSINIFTLITGYFMVGRKLTVKRIVKILIPYIFWNYLINIVFLLTGYAEFGLRFLKGVFPLSFVLGVDKGYGASMIAFYLLIPFLNILIKGMGEKMHLMLLGLLLFFYSIISTFSLINNVWGFIPWLCIMYLIGAYIKLYPCKWFESWKIAAIGLTVSVGLIWLSMLVVDFIGARFGYTGWSYMMGDCNKITVLGAGLSIFLLCKNLPIPQSKVINAIAACSWGVLLIHANSDTMRSFLWGTLLRNAEAYKTAWFPLHAILSVLGVYIVCTALEMLRSKLMDSHILKRIPN
jgi:hypothetical protein